MLKTLKSKLIMIHILTQILFLVVFIILGSRFVNQMIEIEFNKRVESFTRQVESAITVAMISSDTATLTAIAQEAVAIPDIHDFSVFLDNKLIHQASSSNNSPLYLKVVDAPVIKNNQTFGHFIFSISRLGIENSRRAFLKNLWIISLIEILLASFIAFSIGNYIGKRAKRLEQGLSVYSNGDVSFRFLEVMQDELGIVERSFNDMAHSIQEKNTHLENLRMQNLVSAKMASLGEMAGGIAHEINNPLAVISMRTEKLKRRMNSDEIDVPKTIEDLQKIETTITRISKIIRGLKNFSRSGASDPMEKVSLKQVVEDSITLSNEKLSNNSIKLKLDIDPEKDFNVLGRFVQLSQVILNLLSNACDAINKQDEKWIEITLKEVNHKVIVSLTDSGSGIPPEIAEKLMIPFFTTKEVGKGTGLGLSISKGIIEEQKGKFYYDPTCSNTRFVIELDQYEELEIS